MTLENKTYFITGASRGIGLAIATRLASEGANIVIAAKTKVPNPKLPGTIYSAAEAVEAAGGKALPLVVDIRDEAIVRESVDKAVQHFGRLDGLINNASAIWLAGALDTPMKRYDLMQQVNSRGTFLCSQVCLPHLLEADNPHILTMAPPPSLEPRWWAPHGAYTLAKMGMSLVTMSLAGEFAKQGMGIYGLWPKTVIATDALKMIPGVDEANTRKPAIVADAAAALLKRDAAAVNGQFFIDEDALRDDGVTDFDAYAVQPGAPLLPDLFL